MADKQNFLLGKGERLTEPVSMSGRRQPPRQRPYSMTEARSRIKPMLEETARSLRELPDSACPNGDLDQYESYCQKLVTG